LQRLASILAVQSKLCTPALPELLGFFGELRH
jgi:hypothetical protein